MHPLLETTLAKKLVHIRGMRGSTLEIASAIGDVFCGRPGDDPIVTMAIESDDPVATPYASCRCAELSLHTDYATFEVPPRFTITRCRRPDPEFPAKGRSVIVRLEGVLEHLRTRAAHLETLLRTTPMPFRRNAEHAYFHDHAPFFTILDEENRVRFDRTLILPTLENSARSDRAILIEAVLSFEDLCQRLGERIEVALDVDDILIIDNRRVVHSRTECTIRRNGEEVLSREVDLAFLR